MGPDRFSLKGRLAVVTGGDGQLGRAFGRALGEAGARVVLTDIPPSSKAEGLPYLRMDVTRKPSVERGIDAIERRWGAIDIWVNNAGIAVFTPFMDRSVEEFDRVMAVNVRGVFLCSQAVSRRMARRRRGCLINIASLYGLVSPDPRIYADSGRNSSEVYGASKAAVIQMTRYLAVHLAPSGIRVNSISPGGVFNHQTPSFVRNYRRRTPLGRMAREEDIVGPLLFLASDASAYMTGQNLAVDGGYTSW